MQNQRHTNNKENTKARLAAVAVKPNFLKKDFKDLTLLLLRVEGKGKTYAGYEKKKQNKTRLL